MKKLKEQLEVALLGAKAICTVVENAERDFTSEERQEVTGYLSEAKELKDKIKAAEGDEDLKKQIAALGIEFAAADTVAAKSVGQRSPFMVPEKGKTIGELFTESEEYKAWYKQWPSGSIPEKAKIGNMNPVGFKTIITGASQTSAGAFVNPDYTGIYEPLGRRPITILDLISRRQTNSDTVQFVRQTAKVTQAAPTAEATATGDTSGSKPEGAVAYEEVTATVKTIAVWIPATKRALSDAAQLRGLIDQELRDDLLEDLEDEIVAGSGGNGFTGLESVSGTLSEAWDTDILTTSRKAVTSVKVTGMARPTAWLVNPSDNETIDLLKDGDNRYYFGGPQSIPNAPLWGYPRVECEAVTAGNMWLGDWRKCVLFDREQATISLSDSHSDFFIRNMVAILAEMRAALGFIRPSAFIQVPLEAGS